MELDRESIVAAGANLAVKGRQLQDALDGMIERHPDNEEFKKMRDFLAKRQEVLHDLLNRIPS